MLPQFYKFVLVNKSGSTVNFDTGAINLKMTAWHITPATGKIFYTPLSDDDMGFDGDENLLDDGEILSTEIDNTTNLYLGLQVQLEVTHDEGAAADGTFKLYLAGGDATGELPTDATGYGSAEAAMLQFVGSMTWDSDGGDDEVMRSQVWNVG